MQWIAHDHEKMAETNKQLIVLHLFWLHTHTFVVHLIITILLVTVGEYNIRDVEGQAMKMYKEFGPIVRLELFPGIVQYHIYEPSDIQTLFRAEGPNPRRILLEGYAEYRRMRKRTIGLANL